MEYRRLLSGTSVLVLRMFADAGLLMLTTLELIQAEKVQVDL
jgi:hypothetical protein